MKYLSKKFTVGGSSPAYSTGWDKVRWRDDGHVTTSRCPECKGTEFYGVYVLERRQMAWRCEGCGWTEDDTV